MKVLVAKDAIWQFKSQTKKFSQAGKQPALEPEIDLILNLCSPAMLNRLLSAHIFLLFYLEFIGFQFWDHPMMIFFLGGKEGGM